MSTKAKAKKAAPKKAPAAKAKVAQARRPSRSADYRRAAAMTQTAEQAQQQVAGRAPSPMPPVIDPVEQQRQFAMGMAINSVHYMRACGLAPDMIMAALLRAVGMFSEALRIPLPGDISGEIVAGADQQKLFMAAQGAARH